MAPTANPLILDFDRSVLPLPGSESIELGRWQEAIRFGCPLGQLRALGDLLAPALARQPGVVFMGSGDYHHITCLLLERYRTLGRPLHIVVFDNHPDNMRYPWGIHCGSWVWHASRLPFVAQIDVLGITSTDVERAHGWENHLRNLRSGRVRYWCVGRDLGWMRWLGITHSRSFASVGELADAFGEALAVRTEPVYLSVDKDVLSAEDAHTNWDQGVMRLGEMQSVIGSLKGRVVGADVTGEVSVYRYDSRFKRMLSGLDGQPDIAEADLQRWQAEHRAVNLAILQALAQ
jgi:arginase family enzyme